MSQGSNQGSASESPQELEVNSDRGHHRTVDLIERVEPLIYLAVGVLFLAASFGVLGYSVYILPENVAVDGFPSAITAFVNELLLVVILVEILRTLLGVLRSEVISLEPFLIVGAISATRRILNVGAAMSIEEDIPAEKFNQFMFDLGMNALVIFVITIALYLMADSKRRSEASPQSSSSRNDADLGRDNPGRDNRGGDDVDSDDPGREDSDREGGSRREPRRAE